MLKHPTVCVDKIEFKSKLITSEQNKTLTVLIESKLGRALGGIMESLMKNGPFGTLQQCGGGGRQAQHNELLEGKGLKREHKILPCHYRKSSRLF